MLYIWNHNLLNQQTHAEGSSAEIIMHRNLIIEKEKVSKKPIDTRYFNSNKAYLPERDTVLVELRRVLDELEEKRGEKEIKPQSIHYTEGEGKREARGQENRYVLRQRRI